MITLTTERIVRIVPKMLEMQNQLRNLGRGHVLQAEIEIIEITIVIEDPTAVIVKGRDQDHDPVTVASTPDAVAQETIVAEILVRGDLIRATATETEKIATEEIVDLVVMIMAHQRGQKIQVARDQQG